MLIFATAVLVVLLVSFMCSIFESVLLSLTRPQIEVMVRDGRRAGSLMASFKENIDIPIAAILILNTAAHTIGAAVAGASYSNVFDPATLWVFSILFTLAVLLFTEIIPKTLGVTHATTLAGPVAHGINWLTRLLRPLVIVSEKLSRLLRREGGIPVTSVEEIRLLAALGRSEGVVGPRTASMIVGATHLRHLTAYDVMLPRERVNFLSAGMSRDEAANLVETSGHSRFPFSPSGTLDDVDGMILAKELLYWLLTNESETIDWDALRRDVLIIPDKAPLPQMLRQYQESRRHLALVVDEYGGLEGIATLEDVLEEVVGDIQDESDEPVDEFAERPDGTLEVDGGVDLRRLSSRLNIVWHPETEASTIGGLVAEELEKIPAVGDTVRWNGYVVEVVSADERRARRLIIRKSQTESRH